MKPMVEVRRAHRGDADRIAPLFDAYRQFYGAGADVAGARAFLHQRLQHHESVVFIADRGPEPLGFCQLYPSFSSVAMARIFVLNDLFVAPPGRRLGIGRHLLQAALDHGRSAGAVRLALATQTSNLAAQALYLNSGWVVDTSFMHFQRAL